MKKYIGDSLTLSDAESHELTKLPESLRIDEADLMKSRWFDYRHLLPAQATYLFASKYDSVYREMVAKLRDYRDAEQVMTLTCKDVFKGDELTSVWLARQAADQIGCKYDFYLRFAFKRNWDNCWKRLARPNQIYSEDMVLDIRDAWEAETLSSLHLAENPRFLPNRFTDHPDQHAYYDYLIKQIKRRPHPDMLLGRLVFRENRLPLDIVGSHFDSDTLLRAKFHAHG